ncbi:MAG: NHLP bacteriocin system secretion protein [Thermoanaerobaculum sp.]|nr:NHLP bacteriocin system secretion protein [Thermoanaerobaculum sp.]
MASNLFRKKALERLSSPERLDELMRVTSPVGWLALAGLAFAIVAALLWGVLGRIAVKVDGKGILMRGGAVYEITSTLAGHVVAVAVEPGQLVRVGDVVLRLDQPELRVRYENTKEELAAISGHGAEQAVAQAQLLSRYQTRAAELRKKIENQRRLVERGLLTGSQLLQTQAELTATEESIANLRAASAGRSVQIEQVRARLRELEAQLAGLTLTSPYNGRVLEVAANVGDLVQPGARLVTLEDPSQPLKAVLFVPAAEGKKIARGMRANVSPSTVRPEEYGFILGHVEEVSEFPLTPEALKRILRNEQLAQELAGRATPIRVTVELVEERDAPSGFRWTSGKGPPVQIFPGTLCQGSVVVETKRPIAYIIPLVKRATGAG